MCRSKADIFNHQRRDWNFLGCGSSVRQKKLEEVLETFNVLGISNLFQWGRYYVELHIENKGDKSIILGLGLSNAQRRSLFYRNLCC